MTDEIRQAKIDLAAALRLAAHFDLHEGIDNHFSYALPGEPMRFLLNPYGLHWSEITAGDLLVLDGEGKVLEGDGPIDPTAFCIHAPIHIQNPKARCVFHTHMPYATALTSLEEGTLEPVSQNNLRFYGDVAYDEDYCGLALDTAEGDRLAGILGDKRILFMANHGVVVVGETIPNAFDDLYFLERACMVQVLAMSTGRPIKRISDNQASHFKADFKRALSEDYGKAHFEALKRILDRQNPGYVN